MAALASGQAGGPAKARTAILISGRGSNMVALLEAAREPGFPAEIALVLANRADAGGLALAAAAGVPTAVVESRGFGRDRAAHEAAVQAVLEAHGIGLVCLAGYMRLLTPWLVGRWAGRMLNIHPSLLPAYPGLDTHARALAAGARLHGCTVHLVTEEMDAGPILAQAAVPVLPDDTEARLAARVLAQEHVIYPAALRQAAGGAVAFPPATAALLKSGAARAALTLLPSTPPLPKPPPRDPIRTSPVAEDQHYEFAATDNKEILADRERSWASFVQFSKWAIAITVVILLALLFFVA